MADTQAPDKYEFYRRVMLPIMGLAEVIGTQGRSPGVTAQRSMQQFDTAESQRNTAAEEAKRTAMEGEALGYKRGEEQRKVFKEQEAEAKMQSYRDKLGMAKTPEEKRKAVMERLAETDLPNYMKYLGQPGSGEGDGGGGLSDEKVGLATKLRGEFIDGTKSFVTVRDAYEGIRAAKPTAAGDLSLIFSYMKMVDPGSTVRESEYANAQNATGVPGKIRNLWNNALAGERLNPAQRVDFIQSAGNMYKAKKVGYSQIKNNYVNLGNSFGIPSKYIVFDLERTDKGGVPREVTQHDEYHYNSIEEAEAANLPKGTEIYVGEPPRKAVVE